MHPDQDKPSSRTATGERKRWAVRFGLRTALILFTTCCIGLAWFVPRVQKQKKAVQWMEQFGRTVYYSHMRKPVGQRDPPAPKWLIDIFGIDTFATIDMVWLDDRPVESIEMIRNLPSINHFELSNGGLTDISPLEGLTQLEHVSISKNRIVDIRAIGTLTRLKRFYANKTNVSDISPLARLHKLENVILSETPVDDVSHLSGLTQLTNLELRKTGVSDLTPLFGLVNLKTLDVRGTNVTPDQLERIRDILPNCKIEF
jgi:hypothetical protein